MPMFNSSANNQACCVLRHITFLQSTQPHQQNTQLWTKMTTQVNKSKSIPSVTSVCIQLIQILKVKTSYYFKTATNIHLKAMGTSMASYSIQQSRQHHFGPVTYSYLCALTHGIKWKQTKQKKGEGKKKKVNKKKGHHLKGQQPDWENFRTELKAQKLRLFTCSLDAYGKINPRKKNQTHC